MKQLHPHIDDLLAELEREQQKALLLWFAAEELSMETTSQRLSAILSEIEQMDLEGCYQSLQSISLEDRVRFAILNEFGPAFAKKPCFDWLAQAIVRGVKRTYG